MVIPISFELTDFTNLFPENNTYALYEKISDLKQSLFAMSITGSQFGSIYDTAYLSTVKDANNRPIFGSSLKFLFQSRNKDFSWGNENILSDSLLCTLVSIYALQQSHLAELSQVQNILTKATDFIYDKFNLISNESFFTAGFEFLIPNLIQKTGLDLEDHPITKKLLSYQEKKLSMIPLEYIQNKKTPMLFALEGLDNFDLSPKLDHFVEFNGSIATSPGTTAWYLSFNPHSDKIPEIITYLSDQYNPQNGSTTSFADYSLMNIPFVLYPLFKANIIVPNYSKFLEYILFNWTPQGVGHSPYFPMTDADDTALSLLLFNKFKLISDDDKKNQSIKAYRKGNYFVTYPWEIGSSNMVNLHVLDMYLESSIIDEERTIIINQLLDFMDKQITVKDGIGGDKYHYSPYCQNAHAVLTLSKEYPEISCKLVDWFFNNQNKDGLWGIHGPSVEETAYAVMALCYYHLHAEKINIERLYKAIDYLLQENGQYQNLWLSKVAYTPIETVQAHILAALELYHQCA